MHPPNGTERNGASSIPADTAALAQGLFSLDGFEVVNVAVPDPAVSNSVIVDHAGTFARRVAY